MRIDLLGLQAFLAISERGSFHSAAAHLNLSQTALSHRIRKLEEDLGAMLLTRTARGCSLTRTGLEILPQVKSSIGQLEDVLGGLRQATLKRQDFIAVGCLPSLAASYLPVAVNRFRLTHPNVQVRIYDVSASDISELLEAGTIAFGINMVAAHRWDFEIELLTTDSFYFVCRSDHPLATRPVVEWSDLREEALVRISQQTGNRLLLDDALGNRREQLRWRYEVHQLRTAIELVRSGLASTVIPQVAMLAGKDRSLVCVPLRNPSISRQIGIMTRRGVPMSAMAGTLKRNVVELFTGTRGRLVR